MPEMDEGRALTRLSSGGETCFQQIRLLLNATHTESRRGIGTFIVSADPGEHRRVGMRQTQ